MECKINTNIQPLFDTEELAKVHYETDVLANGGFSVMAEEGSLIVLSQNG
jgi:trimethylamine:corrinoid methyltransferase-like protein